MADNPIDFSPAKRMIPIVSFAWGTTPPKTAHYCGWTDDFDVATTTFVACPGMEVDLGKQGGAAEDNSVFLTMPITTMPVANLIRPYAHAPVYVEIREIDHILGNETIRIVYAGWVDKATLGYNDNQDSARLELAGVRSMMKTPTGMQSASDCIWTFGDHNCRFPIATIQETSVATVLQNKRLWVPGLSAGKLWNRGWVEYDGLRLTIDAPMQAGGELILDRFPPPEWVGQPILCTPGCDKKVATCRDVYDNIDRIVPLGIKMPIYKPETEEA